MYQYWKITLILGIVSVICVLDSELGESFAEEKPTNVWTNTDERLQIMNRSLMNSQREWDFTYGGSLLDWGWAIENTNDGGYIVAGETVSYGEGNYDAWLLKIDCHGNEEWNRTFGGTMKDGARSVQQTTDGGYIVGGYTDSYGYPGHDFWLIKTDNEGNEEWNRVYGGPESDACYSVRQTEDGGYVITGYTYSFGSGVNDVWLIKTDCDGNEEWFQVFGGPQPDQGMTVRQANDGGYVIAGATASFGSGGTDAWMIKTDSLGNEEWDVPFGGPQDDWAGSLCLTSDGGYIIAGDTKSFGSGGYDVWLICLNSQGNELWNRTFGRSDTDDTGYCIQSTGDGGYIITGTVTPDQGGRTDFLLIKTDQEGYLDWEMTFGGTENDFGYYVCEGPDGGYAMTGFTESYGAGNKDVWVIKVTSSGTCIIDDGSPEFMNISGLWSIAGHPSAYMDSAHFVEPGIGNKRAGWRLDNTISPAYYDVYMWKFEHSHMDQMSAAAPVKVFYDNGISPWIFIDQSTSANEWVYLGNFPFTNHRPQGVMITSTDNGFVIADAIKLVATD